MSLTQISAVSYPKHKEWVGQAAVVHSSAHRDSRWDRGIIRVEFTPSSSRFGLRTTESNEKPANAGTANGRPTGPRSARVRGRFYLHVPGPRPGPRCAAPLVGIS